MQRGLSLSYSVRGGKRLYFSQQFATSLSYCSGLPSCDTKHLFLCLLLLSASQLRDHEGTERIHIIGIEEECCCLPLYHIQVKMKKANK